MSIHKQSPHTPHTYQIKIAKGLEANKGLIEIDLSWNRVRGKAAVALANSVRANPKLQILHCGWNGLADIGAKAFAEALNVAHVH